MDNSPLTIPLLEVLSSPCHEDTLNPKTLNPKTPNPKPQTLNPKPDSWVHLLPGIADSAYRLSFMQELGVQDRS